MPLIGYARVSRGDSQTTDAQRAALEQAGCERIFEDVISGAIGKRPGLDATLAALQPGDTLCVVRLDRLARSLADLITTLDRLGKAEVAFRSLSEQIDTSTAAGKLVTHVLGAIAEFERSLIRERTLAGLDAARLRGAKIGRPRAMTAHQLKIARRLIDEGETWAAVAKALGVGRATLGRYLSGQRLPAH